MKHINKFKNYIYSFYFPVLLSIPISFSNTASFIEQYMFRDWEFLKYLMILVVVDTLVSWVFHLKNKDFSSKGFGMIAMKLIIYGALLIVSHVLGNFTIEGGSVESYTWFKSVVCNALIIRESISIVENTSKLCPNLVPSQIKKYLADFDENGFQKGKINSK